MLGRRQTQTVILRDEVGLVCAISVKVSTCVCGHYLLYLPNIQEHSSAKRKELFKTVQAEKAAEKARLAVDKSKNFFTRTKQLILDMPIQWSSTYGMLHRADQLKEVYIIILSTVVN